MNNEHDLKVAIVTAVRALGFLAKRIGSAGEPDGLARFQEGSNGPKVITLEAKSSGAAPSLAQIDFSGIKQHMIQNNPDSCMLVAPSYPGESRENDSDSARRATADRISCWTVRQLADVVAASQTWQISVQQVFEIVLKNSRRMTFLLLYSSRLTSDGLGS